MAVAANRMAANESRITITAKDEASKVFDRLNQNWKRLAAGSLISGLGVHSLANFINQSTDSANKLQGALLGLSSVASAFGQDVSAVKQAAQELSADGFMNITESANGLKNLLSSGFGIDQAMRLMIGLKN